MSHASNLVIVENAGILLGLANSRIHATNGTYKYDANIVVPTTLAGFQFIADHIARPTDAFLIAVNSDKSMRDFSPEPTTQNQEARALKATAPLAQQHPDRKVFVTYYDEETPNSLYDGMAASFGIELASLHKWGGYGVNENAPVIEGAEHFDRTFAFPFPNERMKPVFFNATRIGGQKGSVEVVDLCNTYGSHRDVYLGPRNGLKFKRK